jgi:hypothetical protein
MLPGFYARNPNPIKTNLRVAMADWSSKSLLPGSYRHAPADQTPSRFTEPNTEIAEQSGGEARSTGRQARKETNRVDRIRRRWPRQKRRGRGFRERLLERGMRREEVKGHRGEALYLGTRRRLPGWWRAVEPWAGCVGLYGP